MRAGGIAVVLACAAALTLAGCGVGTAGIFAGTSGGGGGGSNAPPVLSGVSIAETKTTPARLSFVLTDAEGDAASVEILYSAPGVAEQRVTAYAGVPANPAVLPAGPGGVPYTVDWHFPAEAGLDPGYTGDVRVRVVLANGLQEVVLGASTPLGVGNDAPVASSPLPQPTTASGNVGLGLTVADSSNDVVSVRVEYDVQGDDPDLGWLLVRPALASSVPEFAIADVVASETGSELVVFWDTLADLGPVRRDVDVRFTPVDFDESGEVLAEGVPLATGVFEVDNDTPTVISGLTVEEPKVAPARLRFVLADAESRSVPVTFVFQLPGGPEELMTALPGLTGNPEPLATTPEGIAHEIEWSFDEEGTLPAGGDFVDDVTVIARIPGGSVIQGVNAVTLGLGNDLPAVTALEVPDDDDISDVVPITFAVTDSSADLVSVRVEYDIDGDVPDTGWLLARPAGLDEATDTPGFAFVGVEAPVDGIELVFNWDSEFDLGEVDRDIRMRVTAVDPVGAGVPAVSDAFRLDGNDEPIVFLDSGLFVLHPDQERGISVPYTVFDEESDPVELVFQWRHEGEPFVDLPEDPGAIAAILADPEQRAAFGIAERYPTYVEGRLRPADATSVELPELAGPALQARTAGLVGAQLELLRPGLPRAVGAAQRGWDLVGPVGALPIGDDVGLVVLDSAGGGAWRLRELDEQTGAVVREIASAATGAPSVLTWDVRGESVLIAVDLDGDWSVLQIELVDGAVTEVVAGTPDLDSGPVRGLARLSPGALALTVGSSLVRVDLHDPTAPLSRAVFDDLTEPWGLVVDPWDANRVWVADSGGPEQGRVLEVLLDRMSREPVRALPPLDGQPALPRPRVVSLDASGTALYVHCVVEPAFGLEALRVLPLAGPPRVVEIVSVLSDSLGSIDHAGDGRLVLTLPGSGDLALGGGVEQQRAITAFDPAARIVTVDAPFDPPARSEQRWRIELARPVISDPDGAAGTFAWDSRAAGSNARVFLRATPSDGDLGLPSETTIPKRVGRFFADPVRVTAGREPVSIAAADLDLDGDVDLAVAGRFDSTVSVLRQRRSGLFTTTLELPLTGTADLNTVASADLDGDGRPDLVTSSETAVDGALGLLLQNGAGGFEPALGLGAAYPMAPRGVLPVDADLDGDFDLVCANSAQPEVLVFTSTAGRFDERPLVLDLGVAAPVTVAVTVADLDGDGRLDIVAGGALGRGASAVYIFYGDTLGGWETGPTTLTSFEGADPVLVVDVDGDGLRDVVGSASAGPSFVVRIAYQEGPRVFGFTEVVTSGPDQSDLALLDIDRDGDLDLVATRSSDVATFLQETPRVFEAGPVLGGGSTNRPGALVVRDLDADGAPELVTANQDGDDLTVLPRVAPGRMTRDANNELTAVALSAAAGDLDGDGDLDLAVAHQFDAELGTSVSLYLQTRHGVFERTPLVLDPPAPATGWVEAVDLDADGHLDLVLVHSTAVQQVSVLYQRAGVFGPEAISLSLPPGFRTRTVTAADIDGDGTLDLLTANYPGSSWSVFFQTGPGAFDPDPLISVEETSVTPEHAIAADIDGDGRRDVVLANRGNFTDSVNVYFQIAPRVFADAVVLGSFGVAHNPTQVAVGDLNGDGLLDIAAAYDTTNTASVGVWMQTAPGQFISEPIAVGDPLLTLQGNALALADVERDGDLDLLVTHQDALRVYRQIAPGVFGPPMPLSTGPQSSGGIRSIQAADLDGDGDIDAAVALRLDGLGLYWGSH